MIVNKHREAQELRELCKTKNIKCVETEDVVHFNAELWGNHCADFRTCPICQEDIWSYEDYHTVHGIRNKLDFAHITVVINPTVWNRKDEGMLIFECPKCFKRVWFHIPFEFMLEILSE